MAALSIYFGGNQEASKIAISEFLKNLTYQALSQENDNIFLSFENGELLIHSILEAFQMKEKDEIKKNIRN